MMWPWINVTSPRVFVPVSSCRLRLRDSPSHCVLFYAMLAAEICRRCCLGGRSSLRETRIARLQQVELVLLALEHPNIFILW